MAEKSSKWNQIRERLRNRYRLIILNDESLAEISNFRVTLGNLYIGVSSIIVALGCLTVLLIFYTPLKRLIPGYGELEDNTKFIELNKDLDTIYATLEAQELYLTSFRKMLIADEITETLEPTEEEKLMQAIAENLESNREISENLRPLLPERNFNTEAIHQLRKDLLMPPVSGLVSAAFNPEIRHLGVDILAPANTPIKAIKDGFVISSAWNLETGNTIGIQHAENMVSFYKHNSVLLKNEGDHVTAGEAVAIIGNSGTLSSGPHLHFELWLNGIPVNPEDYINFE